MGFLSRLRVVPNEKNAKKEAIREISVMFYKLKSRIFFCHKSNCVILFFLVFFKPFTPQTDHRFPVHDLDLPGGAESIPDLYYLHDLYDLCDLFPLQFMI